MLSGYFDKKVLNRAHYIYRRALNQHCWDVFSRILPIKSIERKYLDCSGVISANASSLLLRYCNYLLKL